MKKIKKGFTLVELLVVIAILAILATVSTITYFVFINSAKQSADEQAVTQMNIALDAQKAIDAPENVEEAKDVLEAAGFNVSDYVPLDKDSIFYYDEEEIKVLIFNQNDKKVTFPEDLAEKYSNVSQKLGYWYLLNDQQYVVEKFDEITGNSIADGAKLKTLIGSVDDNTTISIESDANLNIADIANFDPLSNIYYFPTNDNGYVNIDLSGNTLTLSNNVNVYVGGYTGYFGDKAPLPANVTISNGIVKFSYDKGNFIINENSSLTFSNVEYVNEGDGSTLGSDGKKYQKNSFTVNDYGTLTISNSVIENVNGDTTSVYLGGSQSIANIFDSKLTSKSYGITTNAQGDLSWNVRCRVDNSTIESLDGPSVLVNVPGQYTFNNCTLNGDGEGVVIRGGHADINNSTITITDDNSSMKSMFKDTTSWEFSDVSKQNDTSIFMSTNGKWQNGNRLQFGGLIVGDWSDGYNYDASVTIANSSVHMDDGWTELPIVYLSQDGESTTTFKYDENTTFYKGKTTYADTEAILKNSVEETLDGLKAGKIISEKI